MSRIFQINHGNNIHHLINIDDQFIIRDDDFISIEVSDEFDWSAHATTCADCQAFLSSIYEPNFKWYFESNGETFLLSIVDFDVNDHFKNQFKKVTALSDNYSDFAGIRVRLKKEIHTIANIDKLLSKYESEEKYEVCQDLKNSQDIIKRQ
ncbi:hypothetical protein [Gilvibacter sp.]|jgi:hypothetical protein|uniref:hypothetical protein n=1 Tax=Gilvibacter sp. TaxID=2729997 RepID=UPI003B520CE4